MNDDRILSVEEWTRWFGVLCRDDGLDDIYAAEEKLQLHDLALRARLADTEAERDQWRVEAVHWACCRALSCRCACHETRD